MELWNKHALKCTRIMVDISFRVPFLLADVTSSVCILHAFDL